MIKICSPQLGMSPSSNLGGEVYDYQIIKGLCNMGVKIYALLPRGRQFERHKNLKVEYLPIMHIPAYLFNVYSLPYIIKLYKKERFDYLRIHNPYFAGFAAYIFKKIYPEVKIFTQILLREDRWDLDFVLSKTCQIYDHFFVLTDYLKSWLVKEYGINPNKITVIYGGVEDILNKQKKDKKMTEEYNLQGKIVLLNAGRLIERKNVIFLVDVFRKIVKKYPSTVLFFCGTGHLKSKINERAKSYGIGDKVFTLGSKFGREKAKVFNLADVFLFPTKNEGFGLVAAEAMACGVPVIGSNNTSIPEVIDNNTNGLLAKTNDDRDWISKISLLIEDSRLRNRMSVKALAKANRVFRWKEVNRIIINTLKFKL